MLFTAELSNILWLHFPSCSMVSLISTHFPSSYVFASGFSCLKFIESRLCFCLLFSLFGMIFWKKGACRKLRSLTKSEVTYMSLRSTWCRCHISMKPSLITLPEPLERHSCSTCIIEQCIMFDFGLVIECISS